MITFNKTALQQLLEFLVGFPPEQVMEINEEVKRLLDGEREQIMAAWEAGYLSDGGSDNGAEEYFYGTYPLEIKN